MINEGLHYRASRDWGELVGFSREARREINIRGIEFYRDFAREYASPDTPMLVGGVIGPRGDAYNNGRMPDAAAMPVVSLFFVSRGGRLKDGETLEEAISRVDSATGYAPEYYMINCTPDRVRTRPDARCLDRTPGRFHA
jgi:S-methylmethionine-dependent homocysteine/selenocysteine methylase